MKFNYTKIIFFIRSKINRIVLRLAPTTVISANTHIRIAKRSLRVLWRFYFIWFLFLLLCYVRYSIKSGITLYVTVAFFLSLITVVFFGAGNYNFLRQILFHVLFRFFLDLYCSSWLDLSNDIRWNQWIKFFFCSI